MCEKRSHKQHFIHLKRGFYSSLRTSQLWYTRQHIVWSQNNSKSYIQLSFGQWFSAQWALIMRINLTAMRSIFILHTFHHSEKIKVLLWMLLQHTLTVETMSLMWCSPVHLSKAFEQHQSICNALQWIFVRKRSVEWRWWVTFWVKRELCHVFND